MTPELLLPLPVVLPLLGAGVSTAIGHYERLQRTLSAVVLVAVLGVALALVVLADRQGPLVLPIGDWPAPYGIVIVADRLSALLLATSAAVTLGVLGYAVGQGASDPVPGTPVSVFHPAYLVLTAGVALAFLAGDLFNLYVAFEVFLTASYVLMTLRGTADRVRAGMTYVLVSLLGSVLFLTAIGLIYGATGSLNLADLAGRIEQLPGGLRAALGLLLLVVFGIKAAVFPLSAWLPDSYPTAELPVTAVFAGLLTKVGVYALIRTQTLLFPGDIPRELLLVVALATMVAGLLGAIAQPDLKRMLSFTLVGHIGYMLFGVALASVAGLTGAILYTVHHITVQTALFLASGLIERRAGTTMLGGVRGLAALAPVTAGLFFVPAMNLAGIPPLSGFVAKLALLQAGVADGGALAATVSVAAVACSLLTLYAVAIAWNRLFWGPAAGAAEAGHDAVDASGAPQDGGDGAGRPSPLMTASTAALAGAGVVFAVLAGPLQAYGARAAEDLALRAPYQQAVLGAEELRP